MGATSSKSSKKAKGDAISDTDKAVLSLKTQRRKLVDYQKKVEKVIARETEIARELLQAKRKDRALLAIKKRKLQEAQLAQVDSWILNVDQMLGNIEQAAFTSKAVAALKEGSAQAKIIQNEISLEEVEGLMDETADAKDYLSRVNEALGDLSAEDAEAAEEELAALESEVFVEGLPSVPAAPVPGAATTVQGDGELELDLPDVPKGIKQPEGEGEKERVAMLA